MKNYMRSIVLLLAVAPLMQAMGPKGEAPAAAKVAETKTSATAPAKKTEVKPLTPATPAAAPKKEEISLKTTEPKVALPAAPAKTPAAAFSTLESKFDKIRKDIIDTVTEAEKYAQTHPTEKEKVLEQLGLTLGVIIGGLEIISGEKLLDIEAMEAMPMPAPAKPAGPAVQKPARK